MHMHGCADGTTYGLPAASARRDVCRARDPSIRLSVASSACSVVPSWLVLCESELMLMASVCIALVPVPGRAHAARVTGDAEPSVTRAL